MKTNFEHKPLSDVLEVVIDRRGVTPKKLGSSFVGTGHRVVSAKMVKNGRVDLNRGDGRCVDEATYSKWMKKTPLQPGDVLLTSEAPLGETAFVDKDHGWCLGQRLFALRADERILDGRFLYYALNSTSVRHELHSRSTGTTVTGLRQSELIKTHIPVPPMEIQRSVAGILGALDDKIELNRRMSETLEAIARTIFKSWFIDFDPVRANADGQSSLPSSAMDLFPGVLTNSDIPGPLGWPVTSLGSVTECVRGRSYRSEELRPGTTALVTLKSFLRGGGYREDGLKPYAGRFRPDQVIEPGEMVIACTDVTQAADVIGQPAIVGRHDEYEALVASLDTVILRPVLESLGVPFLYFLAKSERFNSHMRAHATGTTVLHLARDAIPSFRFPLPPKRLLEEFDAVAAPMMQRLEGIATQNRTLAETRDALLPRLISGDLRLRDLPVIAGEMAA